MVVLPLILFLGVTVTRAQESVQESLECTFEGRHFCDWLNLNDPDAGHVYQPVQESKYLIQERVGRWCYFEDDFCSWVNQQVTGIGVAQWELHVGASPLGDLSGPQVDNTYGNETGCYVIVDSTKGVPGSSAVLILDIDLSGIICLNFFYHMFGPDVGTLVVGVILPNSTVYPVWYVAGEQGNQWLNKTLKFSPENTMNSSNYRIFFMYNYAGYLGIGALDDVMVYECGPQPENDEYCLPNGTIVIQNPRPEEFTDALAYHSVNLCPTIFSSDLLHVTITGCDIGFLNDMIIIFQNQTIPASDGSDVIVGGERPDVGAYKITCHFFNDTVLIANVFKPMKTAFINEQTPMFNIESSMRLDTPFGTIIKSALVGSAVIWAIDIPSVYAGLPENCRVFPGTTPVGPMSKALITTGCSTDLDLVLHFSSSQFTVLGSVKRYYTTLYTFKFYLSDYITIACKIRLCPNSSDSCDFNCGGRGKRDDGQSSSTLTTITSVSVKIVAPDEGMGSSAGSHFTKILALLVVFWYCLLHRLY